MRVISGKYKGLRLAEFGGEDVRPTSDRVKESLFNILYDRIAGARVLDLFCGSGNLGIECMSRGAEFVQFNDRSQKSLEILRKNLFLLKNAPECGVTNLDFKDCLARGGRYDLIFIDPPYRLGYGLEALEIIGANGILNEGGVAVFERDRSFEGGLTRLKKTDERKYGKTFLTFFVNGEEN